MRKYIGELLGGIAFMAFCYVLGPVIIIVFKLWNQFWIEEWNWVAP